MVDRSGKTLAVGQSVDILLSGMFTGTLVEIHDVPMAVSQNKFAPPQLVIQISVHHVPKDGIHAGVYIVADEQPEAASKLVQ